MSSRAIILPFSGVAEAAGAEVPGGAFFSSVPPPHPVTIMIVAITATPARALKVDRFMSLGLHRDPKVDRVANVDPDFRQSGA
jgi:hypothetical protein